MTVEQITELRNRVRKASGAVRVVKNTFLRRAAADSAQAGIAAHAKGPNVIVLAGADPVEVVKVVTAAGKDFDKFQLKGGVVDGRAVTAAEIGQIAALPSRAVLLGRLVGSLASPMRGLASVCQGNIRKLVYALDAVRQAKEKSAA